MFQRDGLGLLLSPRVASPSKWQSVIGRAGVAPPSHANAVNKEPQSRAWTSFWTKKILGDTKQHVKMKMHGVFEASGSHINNKTHTHEVAAAAQQASRSRRRNSALCSTLTPAGRRHSPHTGPSNRSVVPSYSLPSSPRTFRQTSPSEGGWKMIWQCDVSCVGHVFDDGNIPDFLFI